MIEYPADPEKFEIFFNLSFSEYSEKNSSFLGTTYPSILYFLNFLLKFLSFFLSFNSFLIS